MLVHFSTPYLATSHLASAFKRCDSSFCWPGSLSRPPHLSLLSLSSESGPMTVWWVAMVQVAGPSAQCCLSCRHCGAACQGSAWDGHCAQEVRLGCRLAYQRLALAVVSSVSSLWLPPVPSCFVLASIQPDALSRVCSWRRCLPSSASDCLQVARSACGGVPGVLAQSGLDNVSRTVVSTLGGSQAPVAPAVSVLELVFSNGSQQSHRQSVVPAFSTLIHAMPLMSGIARSPD